MPILLHSFGVDFKALVVIPKVYAYINKEIIPYVSYHILPKNNNIFKYLNRLCI